MGKHRKQFLGPTGRFPNGKVFEDDEGELYVGIGHDLQRKIVFVDFAKRVAWLGIDAATARKLAARLIEHADKLEAGQ